MGCVLSLTKEAILQKSKKEENGLQSKQGKHQQQYVHSRLAQGSVTSTPSSPASPRMQLFGSLTEACLPEHRANYFNLKAPVMICCRLFVSFLLLEAKALELGALW